MAEFRMPSLGADMEAGTLRAWRCEPGDRLERGDIIAEVETEKGIIEVEVFSSGVVERLLVEPGTRVPVGTALATLDEAVETTAGERPPPRSAPQPEPTGPVRPPLATPSARRLALERGVELATVHGTGRHGAVTRPDVATTPAWVKASPLARARARSLGVALEAVEPSGPSGSVIARDVDRAAVRRPEVEAPAPTGDARAAMRRAIAAAMARSKREIPHYYVAHTIDLEPALAWMAKRNEPRPIEQRLVAGVLLLRAVVIALRKVPELNAHYDGERATPLSDIHLGVAVSLRGGGLIAPAIMGAGDMSTDDLMTAFQDLVSRAREGRVRASELASPTITVTSLGDRGVDEVLPVIVPPQVAIVGFGAVALRPFVVDGTVVPRRVVRASLAADHRVSDGHRGGLFLAAVAANLKDPEKL